MTDEMNGAPTLTKDQQDVVKFLEQLISVAKLGQISSIGVVLVPSTGSVGINFTQCHMMELYWGAHDLAESVKHVVRQNTAAKQQQASRIVRPPPGFQLP